MIRIFALVIVLLGIAQTVLGIWMLFAYDETAKLMEAAKMAGQPILQGLDIGLWRRNIVCTAVVLAIVGIAYLLSGFGLLKLKKWSRKLWLFVVSFSMVFYGNWFIFDVRSGYLEFENWLELLFDITLFVLSWWYFTRPETRQAFLA